MFTGYYKYDSNHRGEASFVTDDFELKGHTSNVELKTSTDLNNRWIYLNYALINEATGQAFDFGREVSYLPRLRFRRFVVRGQRERHGRRA